MNVIFTKHAEEKLQERKISRDLVISCVNAPDYVVDSKFGRKIMKFTMQCIQFQAFPS